MPNENTAQEDFRLEDERSEETIEEIELNDGGNLLDTLDDELDYLFELLDTAFPDKEVRANLHFDLQTAQGALINNLDTADNLFSNIRIQWKEAVEDIDAIIDAIFANPAYDIVNLVQNVDGVLQPNGIYSAVDRDQPPILTTANPDLPVPLTESVVDNTRNIVGNTVVSFDQYSAYRNAILEELDVILNNITTVKNNSLNDSNYTMNKPIRKILEQNATNRGFSKKPLELARYAAERGYENLSAEEILELDQAIFKETKILGYTRVKKIIQSIIRYMFNNIKENEDNLDVLFNEIVNKLKTSSQREKLYGISFTGNDINFTVVYAYTFSDIIKRESYTYIDEGFRNTSNEILEIFKKYKQEVIQINAYESNSNFGPEIPYKSDTVYTTTDFIPHTMYNPTTGEAVFTATYQDHINYSQLGYVHTKPVIETSTTTSTTATTSVTTTPSSSTSTTTSYSSGY